MKFLLLISLISIFFTSQAWAREIEIIKEHSKISFDIDYMLMTKVQGQFKDYRGTLNINEEKGELYNINVIAVVNSIDTNDAKRDFHLKGMEFFQATNYPEIIFESKGPFKISSQKKFSLVGVLTVRGIKRPIILEGIYKGKLKDPWNKENYFFELTGDIDRKAYGMVWNKKMDNGGVLIGDKAHISITIQAQATGDKTAFSTHMIPSTKGIIERDQLKKGLIKKLSTSTDPIDHPSDKEKK
ncbi:MAG: YceI family protein [Bacteriovorax sp.]|nr:YceI family protein [Bacteriovorax sp.]